MTTISGHDGSSERPSETANIQRRLLIARDTPSRSSPFQPTLGTSSMRLVFDFSGIAAPFPYSENFMNRFNEALQSNFRSTFTFFWQSGYILSDNRPSGV
jgi:hypothetical protein